MKFLDRIGERARLDRLVQRRAAGLIAVWGRRRVGKTRLLADWCTRHGGVYSVADQSVEVVQRRYFAEAVSIRLSGFNDVEYPNWISLFRHLSAAAKREGWRGPLVLDEFPYLAVSSPELPSILQNWIDHEAADAGLLVAIAGSSQRMMQGLVLDSSAPLYGRALEAFALQPIPAGWIGEALNLDDPLQAVAAYGIWGGIPRYWELAAPFEASLVDAVDALVLDPLGPLHQEPDRLLIEEMPSALALRPLLDVIGNGCHRLSEIAGRLGCPSTSLARPLTRLNELGLISREVPHGESEKASKRAIYRISDPFFAFWFRVVAPHRGALAGATAAVRRQLLAKYRSALIPHTWEYLCRLAAPILIGSSDEPLNTLWLPAARWWHGNAPEWDVVLAAANGSCGAVGEVKWSDTPADEATLRRIATDLSARPLPSCLPKCVSRFIFASALNKNTCREYKGVRFFDAADVMACLR